MLRNIQSGRWHLQAVLAFALFCGGCCLVTPAHSQFQEIHQLVLNDDIAGVAADLDRAPSDLNLREDDGLTPLHLAVLHCRLSIVKLLISKGADLNAKATGGATPLHFAAQEGCAEGIVALRAGGARIDSRDDQGRTPLDRAKLWHQTSVEPLLQPTP